jgi:2-oxoglutarate dehydrogenase E2 component (dihydrolipoamide succinyltransferase)
MLDIKVPTVGESVTEVTISSWLKKEGEYVEQDEVIAEIESDKASFELTAESPGILHIKAKEGDTIAVGSVVAGIDTNAKSPEPAKTESNDSTVGKIVIEQKPGVKEGELSPIAEKHTDTYASAHPSPAAEKILSEKGLGAKDVKGTGIDGRITKEDALKVTPEAKPKKEESIAATSQVKISGEREVHKEKMSTLRKTIARRLVEAKNTTAMLTTFNEADMSAIMDIRKKYKEIFKEKHSVGLGFMSFFTKACTEAIKEFPAVNAMIDGEEILYHDYVDVGVAVSTPRGLVVPNIRNAESLSLAEIEKAILDLAIRARDNKISIDEMTGGTFTITNGGVFGSLMSTPILNAPQSAILGMHNIVERPVAVNGQVVIRPMMYLALSYDHRIVDGRESVSFLVKVKQMLEDPYRLLLGV